MEKKMETVSMFFSIGNYYDGLLYIGTTVRIRSFLPS